MVPHAKSSRDCRPRSCSAGTSRVTTLPAPTIAFSPMTTFARIGRSRADRSALLYQGPSRLSSPFRFGARRPAPVARGYGVVDKCHAVTDEDVVLDRHALANEGVARDLAAPSNPRVLLDLNKSADLCFVADLAAVQIDELRKLDGLAELHIRRNRAEFVLVHRRTSSPLFWIEASAASSMRTTRNPAWPSLKGVLLFMMQSAK